MKKIKDFLLLPEVMVLFLYVIGMILFAIYANEVNKQLSAKDAQIFELRQKINNYLISSGEYQKPVQSVLPVLKNFGIVESFDR